MPSHRSERINSDFRRELALCISKMKDPRISFLEVVRVKVTPDLNYAKVYIASISGGDAAAEACNVLKKAEGYIKTELATGKVVGIIKTVVVPVILPNSNCQKTSGNMMQTI